MSIFDELRSIANQTASADRLQGSVNDEKSCLRMEKAQEFVFIQEVRKIIS